MEHQLQRLHMEGKAQLPALLCPVSTSAVEGDTERIGTAFVCASGVPLVILHNALESISSLVRKEGSWSEISLVTIAGVVVQRLLKRREPFFTHTQSDITLPWSITVCFWKYLSRVTILLTNTMTEEH